MDEALRKRLAEFTQESELWQALWELADKIGCEQATANEAARFAVLKEQLPSDLRPHLEQQLNVGIELDQVLGVGYGIDAGAYALQEMSPEERGSFEGKLNQLSPNAREHIDGFIEEYRNPDSGRIRVAKNLIEKGAGETAALFIQHEARTHELQGDQRHAGRLRDLAEQLLTRKK